VYGGSLQNYGERDRLLPRSLSSLLVPRLLGRRRFRLRELPDELESEAESDSEPLELESESESESLELELSSDDPLDDELMEESLREQVSTCEHTESLHITHRFRFFRSGPASFELPSFALDFSFSVKILFATPLLHQCQRHDQENKNWGNDAADNAHTCV
jgi:hypothetical protein